MQAHTEWRRLPQGGLTLVELLVAMAIALLMAGVVAALYAAVVRVADARARRLEQAEPARAVLEILALDLAGAAAPWGATNPALSLAPLDPREGAGMELALTTVEPVPDDLRAYALRAVRYRFAEEPPGATRVARGMPEALPGDAPRTTAWALAGPVRVELLRGTDWTNAWGAQAGLELPRAARLGVGPFGPSGEPAAWAEVLIPAGHTIQRAP